MQSSTKRLAATAPAAIAAPRPRRCFMGTFLLHPGPEAPGGYVPSSSPAPSPDAAAFAAAALRAS